MHGYVATFSFKSTNIYSFAKIFFFISNEILSSYTFIFLVPGWSGMSSLCTFSLAHLPPQGVLWMNTLFFCTKKKTKVLGFVLLPGENVILNLAKALWSPGIYHRVRDCFQTLKLKSGGLILRLSRSSRQKYSLSLFAIKTAHLPPHHQLQIHHHPHQQRDHHREIKDYHRPRAVFIRNQLQGFHALLQPVDTQLQFISTWVELSIPARWKL